MSENNPLNNLVQTAIQIMVIKSLLPFILFFIVLVLICAGIQRCSIEQNDNMACEVTEEEVLWKLHLPYSARKTFKYSEIIYSKKDLLYIINGSIRIKYANGDVDIKRFQSKVETKGNDRSDFDVIDLEFIKDKE